jgi:hypothetical protein
MNTGMADAYDLAGRLAAVTSGAADPSVLDGYDRERRAAATAVLAFTDRMTRVASLRSAPARALRNLALPTLTRIPAVRAAITLQVTGLARSPCGTEPSSRSPPQSRGGSHGHGRGRPDRRAGDRTDRAVRPWLDRYIYALLSCVGSGWYERRQWAYGKVKCTGSVGRRCRVGCVSCWSTGCCGELRAAASDPPAAGSDPLV